jgi:PAS domain S-box-containing protein
LKPLRLLVVEDPTSDYQFLLAELRRYGYVLFHERVDTAAAMRAALEREEWDAVVSDYVLANFNGMEALFLAQAHDPDLPLILFADDVGDERIVAAMKAGARDFISRDRLERLAPALRREIDQAAARRERRRAEAALRESEARHRAIVADQTDLICCFIPDRTLVFVNDAYCRYLGQSRHTLLGRNFMQFVPAEDQAAIQTQLESLTRENTIAVYESPIFVADNRVRWVQWTHRAIFDEQGRLAEYQSVGRDITERKQMEVELRRARDELERRVAARTAELEQTNAALRESEARYRALAEQLEAANETLKSFSYSVSHDLKRPVTQIFGFTDILIQDYASQLDPIALNSLQNIHNSARHMGELIDALLELSLVGQRGLVREAVNLSDLAASIAAELRQTQVGRVVDFVIAPDIMARGDERLLHVALYNILENAWKYTGKQPQARIEFGVNPAEPPVYFVRDNGAGFDAGHADDIFQPFQRLHDDDYNGTGIGLATVQRIIHRHDGRIWVESAIGEGTTFYFTLEFS